MSEKTTGNIQYLCPRCYMGIKNTPSRKHRDRPRYRIWIASQKQASKECALCHAWGMLNMYEWEDADSAEDRRWRAEQRNRNYRTKPDRRARYREKPGEETEW